MGGWVGRINPTTHLDMSKSKGPSFLGLQSQKWDDFVDLPAHGKKKESPNLVPGGSSKFWVPQNVSPFFSRPPHGGLLRPFWKRSGSKPTKTALEETNLELEVTCTSNAAAGKHLQAVARVKY